jgi:hypothetical protein
LPNYLGWRSVLDANRLASPEALLKAAIGAFPHLTDIAKLNARRLSK